LVRLKVVIFAAALAVMIFAPAGQAQTATSISVVQGNGQMICDSCANRYNAFDDLIVLVSDASGNPVPNATVNWIVTSGPGGGSIPQTTVTSAGPAAGTPAAPCTAVGHSCNIFNEGLVATQNLIQSTVSASISNGQSVTFHLTQIPQFQAQSPSGNPYYANVVMSFPQSATTFTGPAGSSSATPSTPVQISVTTNNVTINNSTAVPYVSVRLFPDPNNPAGGPSVSCVTGSGADPGSVLTDSNGNASCTLMFGPVPTPMGANGNPLPFYALVGGVASNQNPNNNNGITGVPVGYWSSLIPINIVATPVNPGHLKVSSGDMQSANAGAKVPNPLVVQVLDSNFSPLAGVPVSWSVTPSNAAAVSPASGTSDNNGLVSTNVTLTANATGTVQVAATVGSLSQSFTITVTVPTPPLSSLTTVSGNNQSVPQGMAFSAPLTVMAALAGGGAASGVPVQFAITGGSGTISASGGAPTQSVVVPTGSNGQASVTATAGSSPGTLTVVASVSGFSQTQTFSLTVLPPPPPISSSSFLNGAGFFATSGSQQTALSPCGVATLVVGSPLPPSAYPVVPNMYTTPLQQPGNISISFQLAGATATTMAPILNVVTASTSQQLITFQVPCEIQANYWSINVSINGSTVTVPGIAVRPGAPGIFETLGSDGVRRAIAVRPDGSIVSLSNPARRGENIRFYITGAGPVLPALASASLPTPGVDSIPTDPNQVVVGLNNSGVGGVMVRAATELIGVYEVTFQVPNDPSLVGTNNVLAVGVTALGNPTQYQQPGGSKLPIQ
jgi:Big-like domain-containing protein